MKRIDETQLLRAVGDVGDDLLLRAERPGTARSRRPWRGALAACLCLVLVLTAVLYLPNSFRMGSSGNTAAEPGAAQNDSAGHPNYEQGQPEAGQEGSDYETAVDAVPEHEGAEKGETGREHPEHGMQDGAACLAELGIGDASALAAAACGGRSVPAADLYQALASAAVMDADRDGAPLQLTEQVTLTLASGAVLEGRGDPAAGVLQLGGYHFYHSDFSVLLKGA